METTTNRKRQRDLNNNLMQIASDEEWAKLRWHVLQLGTMTQDRKEGVFRILGGQLNGMCSSQIRDKKYMTCFSS